MEKIVGSVLLFVACTGIGFYKAQEYGERIRQIRILVRISEYLKGEIEFYRTTIPNDLEHIREKSEEPFSEFLQEVSRQMMKQDGRKLTAILQESMEKLKKSTSLHQEDKTMFAEYVGQLGYLDKNMQIHLLEEYKKEQEKQLEFLAADLPGKQKLFSSLGILGGAFLILLFC